MSLARRRRPDLEDGTDAQGHGATIRKGDLSGAARFAQHGIADKQFGRAFDGFVAGSATEQYLAVTDI